MAAKKKHHTKKTAKRHGGRRMGSVHTGGIMTGLEQAVGLIGASVAGSVLSKVTANVNPKITALAQLGFGWWMTGHPNNFIKGAGYGFMGTGAISLTHNLGMIRGVDDMISGLYGGESTSGMDEVNGISNNNFLNGISNSDTLSGADYQEEISMMTPLGR